MSTQDIAQVARVWPPEDVVQHELGRLLVASGKGALR